MDGNKGEDDIFELKVFSKGVVEWFGTAVTKLISMEKHLSLYGNIFKVKTCCTALQNVFPTLTRQADGSFNLSPSKYNPFHNSSPAHSTPFTRCLWLSRLQQQDSLVNEVWCAEEELFDVL